MAESYQEMISAIKHNIKTSFSKMQVSKINQVLDTVIGVKAGGAASSSASAQPAMQIG